MHVAWAGVTAVVSCERDCEESEGERGWSVRTPSCVWNAAVVPARACVGATANEGGRGRGGVREHACTAVASCCTPRSAVAGSSSSSDKAVVIRSVRSDAALECSRAWDPAHERVLR